MRSEVSTGSGSDRVSTLHKAGEPEAETRSLPLPVLTSYARSSDELKLLSVSEQLKMHSQRGGSEHEEW